MNSDINVSPLQEVLTQVQLRLQVVQRRHLTHKELAKLAHTSHRSIAEWMRGATAPMAMSALLHLLAELPPEDVAKVLDVWRSRASGGGANATPPSCPTHITPPHPT